MKIMMRIINFVVFLLLFFSTQLLSQQDPQFTHFMFNNMMINPAYAGSSNGICGSMLVRNQWMGFDGAPKSSSLNVNAPFSAFNREHGVGLSILLDEVGFFKNIDFMPSYSYKINMASGELGIGIGALIRNHTLSSTDWHTPEEGLVHSPSDPYIPMATAEKPMKFSAFAGVFYRGEGLYLGLSASNLFGPSFSYSDTAILKYRRHYYITSGYSIQMANPIFELRPSVMVKFDGTIPQMDINALLYYNRKIWGGASWRSNEAALLFGFELNSIKLGISYDINYTKMISNNSGTLEIMVNYCFSVQRERGISKYRSIIYL